MKPIIFVIGAAYGTTAAGADVTKRVQDLVEQGHTEFLVSNETLGGDPVPGVKKQFGITYNCLGLICARAATEGDVIKLGK
jgi:hypothetical protein